jgi:hypothetical protein
LANAPGEQILMTVADLEQHLARERELGRVLREQYAGQWVAVVDHEVIDSADSEEELLSKVIDDSRPYRWFRVTDGAFTFPGYRTRRPH